MERKKQTEIREFEINVVNQNQFPKDTVFFQYTGKKAHNKVVSFGGTGYRRRWNIVDTHDSFHMNLPCDLYGPYSIVSSRYHKWLDLRFYGHRAEKLQIWPVKGDAV